MKLKNAKIKYSISIYEAAYISIISLIHSVWHYSLKLLAVLVTDLLVPHVGDCMGNAGHYL